MVVSVSRIRSTGRLQFEREMQRRRASGHHHFPELQVGAVVEHDHVLVPMSDDHVTFPKLEAVADEDVRLDSFLHAGHRWKHDPVGEGLHRDADLQSPSGAVFPVDKAMST